MTLQKMTQGIWKKKGAASSRNSGRGSSWQSGNISSRLTFSSRPATMIQVRGQEMNEGKKKTVKTYFVDRRDSRVAPERTVS